MDFQGPDMKLRRMGKTLQAVALLAADADEDKRDARKKASADAPPPEVLDSKDGSHAYELPRTTLIVLPSSALFQWASELERFWVGPSAPKVLLYYSKRKGLTPAALAGYDVVLTTYPVLENEYRARVNVTKLECEFCKRKMLPRKLKMHYKYQCGPLSERTEKQQLTMRAAGDESAPSVKMPKRRKVPKADSGPLNSAALKSEKAPKKPGGPKAARSAFHHYLEATKDAVAAEVRLTEAPEKGAAAALQRSRWKDLGKAARAPYQATADADKKRYEEEAEEVDDEELECTPVVSQAAKAAKAAKADDDDGDATAPPAKAPSAKAPSAKAAVGAAAMERLVVASRPTPSNIYKDLMRDAGRADEILSQFTPGNSAKGRKAAVSQEASQGSADADASQGGGARKRKASPADAPPEKARARAGATPRESIDVEEDSRRAGQKEHDDTCALCGADGELLCCDACPAALHVCCAGLDAVPDGCWHCPTCVLKRDEPKRLSGGAKLPRALRQLADVLSPGARDAAPSPARGSTSEPRAPRSASKRAEPTPLTMRQPSPSPSWKAAGAKAEDAPAGGRKAKAVAAKARPAKRSSKKDAIVIDDDADFEPKAEEVESSSDDEYEGDDSDDAFPSEKLPARNKGGTSRAKKPKEEDFDADDAEDMSPEDREAAIEALVLRAVARKASAEDDLKRTKRKKAGKSSKRLKKPKCTAGGSSDDSSSSSGSDVAVNDDEGRFFAPPDVVKDVEGVDLRGSLLHCALWRRVILDEAHRIKGFTSSEDRRTAKSVFALRADRRWCLTGTPLQNRVKELQALVRFLRVDPYAYYFCTKKGCDCKSLVWAMGCHGARCELCGHTPMQHYNHFNKRVLKPIEQAGYAGAGARALGLLREDILNVVMLRRTKKERAADLKLPCLVVREVLLELTPEERDFYECIFKKQESRFATFVNKGTVLHNYAHIFELLARLRQALDHPYLVVHGPAADAEANAASAAAGFFDLCSHCNQQIATAAECVVASCKHAFHRDCVAEVEEAAAAAGIPPECPTCFQKLTIQIDKLHGLDEDDDDGDPAKATATAKKVPKEKTPKVPKQKVVQSQSVIDKGLATLGIKPTRLGANTALVPPLAMDGGASDDDSVPELPEARVDAESQRNIASAERNVCVVCLDAARDTMLYNCGHVCACQACVVELRKLDQALCPLCREPIRRVATIDAAGGGSRLGRASILQRVDLSKWRTSTKVEACFNAIADDRAQDESIKAIVFSQYRTMLDICEWRLRLGGLRVVKIMGDMPLTERKTVLDRFKADPSIAVILLSLKAGGEGLNLQEASRVYLLEPWWNPAVEMQAVQRAHRIGQHRDVIATRFITSGTIEEKMFDLQEKKRLVFEGTVDGSAASFAKLSTDDLSFLFTR